MMASIATALAEILGGAIALDLLFDVPLVLGSIITAVFLCCIVKNKFLS